MKYQRVKMVVEFAVPVGEEHYGSRTTKANWKKYAEHDMLEHLKDSEDIPDVYRETVDRWSGRAPKISFAWMEEFEE